MPKVQTGTVKFFNDRLGFGFVIPDGSLPTDGNVHQVEVLVHHSVIEMNGFRTLPAGARVKYTAVRSAKGLAATWCQQLPVSTWENDVELNPDAV